MIVLFVGIAFASFVFFGLIWMYDHVLNPRKEK